MKQAQERHFDLPRVSKRFGLWCGIHVVHACGIARWTVVGHFKGIVHEGDLARCDIHMLWMHPQ